MHKDETIVAIAADEAMLRSLAFALGVEGFTVRTCATWRAARPLIDEAICVIVDVDICRKEAEARRSLADPACRMIVMTDGLPAPEAALSARLVSTPLVSADILAAVDRFRGGAT